MSARPTVVIATALWAVLLVGCGADPEGPANAGRDTALPDAGQDTNDGGGMDASETDNDLVTVNWNVVGINPQDVTVTVSMVGSADSFPVWTGKASESARLLPDLYEVEYEAEGYNPTVFTLDLREAAGEANAPPVEMEPEPDPCVDNSEDVDYYEIHDYLWTVEETGIINQEYYVVPEADECILYDAEYEYPYHPPNYRYSGGDTMEISFGVAGFKTAYGTPR